MKRRSNHSSREVQIKNSEISSHTHEHTHYDKKQKQKPGNNKCWQRNWSLLCTAGGNLNWYSCCGKIVWWFLKKVNIELPSTSNAMAIHSSTLAWKIPRTEEPGGLQSMGSLESNTHDWATSLSLFTFMHWRRKWQPTPVFLPGESQGQGSLVGCRLWGHTESDTTEVI